MRLTGTLAGDGGGFDFQNLFYLSLHTLDSRSGLQYAKARVYRELLDAWLGKKLSFNGKKFQDVDVSLTEQDTFVENTQTFIFLGPTCLPNMKESFKRA